MAIEIRDAVEDDLEKIVSVHTRAWKRAFRELMPEEYLESDSLVDEHRSIWMKHFEEQSQTLRVSEVDGKVQGFLADRPEGAERELTALYVSPMHWSTGVGSGLQRDARDRWHAAGVEQAFLWCAVESPRAHRSYKKNGWVVTEETKTYMKGDKYPLEVVKLTLTL